MRCHKQLRRIICLLCAVFLLFPSICVPTFASEVREITATTGTSVKQGSTGTCYVYIDSLESLAALDVTVHFDNTKVKINNVYNSVSSTLYDNAKTDDSIQFSYIFDGKGTATKTRLFYFSYQVLSNAEVGEAHFDITIGEAYDSSLNEISVVGSRCSFSISETVTTKSCSVSGTATVSTAVEEEFSLTYNFSTYQIASGSAVITYDHELFEVVEVMTGGFLANKVSDVNADFVGAVYVSFAGAQYNTSKDFITVKFKTLKNVTESSTVSLKITELLDKDLNPISCSGFTTTANVLYDSSFLGDAPKMWVDAEIDKEAQQVIAEIKLEENSKLGAGDFVLTFDSEVLSFVSCEQGFEPDFFYTNETELERGIFKFSVISMEDICSAQTVATVVFDVKQVCTEQSASLDLGGSVLTDSATNTIALNLIDGSVTIPIMHSYSGDCDSACNGCGVSRTPTAGHVFSDASDTVCDVCEYERILESIEISAFPNTLTYPQGSDGPDVTGGRLTLVYADGSTEEVDMTPDSVSGFDSSVAGEQTLTVTWGGKTASFTVTVESTVVLGDADGDGIITSDDASYLLGYTLFPQYYPVSQPCDFNGDGKVNSDDATYLLGHTLFPNYYPLH